MTDEMIVFYNNEFGAPILDAKGLPDFDKEFARWLRRAYSPFNLSTLGKGDSPKSAAPANLVLEDHDYRGPDLPPPEPQPQYIMIELENPQPRLRKLEKELLLPEGWYGLESDNKSRVSYVAKRWRGGDISVYFSQMLLGSSGPDFSIYKGPGNNPGYNPPPPGPNDWTCRIDAEHPKIEPRKENETPEKKVVKYVMPLPLAPEQLRRFLEHNPK